MDPRIDTLLARLNRSREELRHAFASVPADRRETRPSEGGWSAANVIEHLAATERAITRLISGYAAAAEPRGDAESFDQSAFEQEIDMPAFLDRSRKIQGSQPSGKVNGETAWQELEASRRELLLALERAADRRLEALSRPHPARPDPLNGYQWIAFIGLHEARHAAQLRDLR